MVDEAIKNKNKIENIIINISLLDNYDYVFDMKHNRGHTNDSLAKLFGISSSTVKRRVSKHKISTVGITRTIRLDKLDTSKPILDYSINTITKSTELTKRLKDETPLLDCYDNVMNSHRYHLLKNNISKIPKCAGCSNKTSLNFEYHKQVFYKYCSHLCNAKHSPIQNKIDKVLTKDWLLEKRIKENLSFDEIGETAGISYQIVKKRLKLFDIDDTPRIWNTNKSKEEIKNIINTSNKTKWDNMYGEDISNKLHDIEFLFDEYVTKKKSAQKISKEMNIDNSTIRRILKHNNIFQSNRRYFNSTSDEEIELYNFIKQYKPSAISGYRVVYRSLELDVYIPELNLGFEYNGCYSHSEVRKNRNYHKNKLKYFNDKGIRVVQIWSDDWLSNPNKVKSMILTRLGVIKKTIHARKCIIKEISNNEYINFLDNNHSLGGANCSIRFGLFYEDMLVSVMGFKRRAKNVNKIGYDLVRFSTLDVHGSFSKLLKHFKNIYPYDEVYSIADLEIVDRTNNVYLTNGFKKVYEIPIDYRYFNYRTGLREDKRNWRKGVFEKMGIDIKNKTERQLAIEYKLIRCYDSGKIMYKLET